MNLNRKFIRCVAMILLLPAMMATSVSGMVLCIGDDGHLAVESEHHTHCGPADQLAGKHHGDEAFRDAGSAECEADSCIDVPLRGHQMSHAVKNLKYNYPVNKISIVRDLSSTHKALESPGSSAPHCWSCRKMFRYNQSLLEKGTIVLRV